MRSATGAAGAPLYLIALNELNFDYVRRYAASGRLPHFGRLIARCGLTVTTTEAMPDRLEPCIQWVTVHTGLAADRHGVFRLGDIEGCAHEQIWEHLERVHGCRVGALSPMNAANRAHTPAFFVPDPWTPTPASGPPALRRLAGALASAVRNHASGHSPLRTYATVLTALGRYSLPRNGLATIGTLLRAVKQGQHRAILLDILLADVFLALTRRHRPDFASLFLNAGAHVQHHYLFSSSAYQGSTRNPDWYVAPGQDPVFDVYAAYDRILGRLLAHSGNARLLLMTALHQDPVAEPVFYYRLRDHVAFLRTLGVPFGSVEARMARDFLVRCADAAEAGVAQAMLASCSDPTGTQVFELDNRGTSLFVTLCYDREITTGFELVHAGGVLPAFARMVVFTGIKNGDHNASGYLIDTGHEALTAPASLPLGAVFDLIATHFPRA